MLSRRAFLRSIGVTACSVSLGGLWLPKLRLVTATELDIIAETLDFNDDPLSFAGPITEADFNLACKRLRPYQIPVRWLSTDEIRALAQ